MTAATAPSTTADAVGAAARPAARPTLVALGVVAIVAVALPFVFLREEPTYFHLLFHVIGLVICGAALGLHRRLRRATSRRSIRVLSWIASVCAIAWSLGHLGELVSVLGHGGVHATGAVFEEPLHVLASTVAVPAWMALTLSTLVLFVTVGVQALLRRVRAVRAAR